MVDVGLIDKVQGLLYKEPCQILITSRGIEIVSLLDTFESDLKEEVRHVLCQSDKHIRCSDTPRGSLLIEYEGQFDRCRLDYHRMRKLRIGEN